MNNKYSFFKYVTGDSKIHKMSSKMKILWVLLTLLLAVLTKDYISLSLISLILIFMIYNSKIPLSAYIKNTLCIWPIYVLIFLISYILSFDILVSLLIVLKFMYIIITLLILTFTTSLSEIAWGFECLFSKLKKIKFPVAKVSLRIALFLKLIATLFEQVKLVRKSMAYRGLPYHSGIIYTFRKIFIPALTLSFRHIKTVGNAMKTRFYGKVKTRTNYHEYKSTNFDKILIIVSFILLYITIALSIMYDKYYIFTSAIN